MNQKKVIGPEYKDEYKRKHRSKFLSDDIETKKLPMWIENFSGAKPNFEFTSGGEYPMDTSKYKLVVHCGGCMLNPKEMASRLERTENIVNYGVAISFMNGILDRALEILK